MGAIAEAFVAFAQPLIDQTDGSQEQLNKAFAISQLCYNLALLPDDQRDTTLDEMQQNLGMDDAEFADFRRSVIDPMIRRHEQMFPGMRGRRLGDLVPSSPSPLTHTRKAAPGERYPGTDRYAPCPCGSGEKYKFCCGAKRR
jgi:SEC-C motif